MSALNTVAEGDVTGTVRH